MPNGIEYPSIGRAPSELSRTQIFRGNYQFESISKQVSKSKIFVHLLLDFIEQREREINRWDEPNHLIKLTVSFVCSHIETKCNHHLLWAIFIRSHLQTHTIACTHTNIFAFDKFTETEQTSKQSTESTLRNCLLPHLFFLSLSRVLRSVRYFHLLLLLRFIFQCNCPELTLGTNTRIE